MKKHEILEIYRELVQGGGYSFLVFLFDGRNTVLKKVSDKMKDEVRKGGFYKQDWVYVEEENDTVFLQLTEPDVLSSYASVYGRKFDSDICFDIEKNDTLKEDKKFERKRLKRASSEGKTQRIFSKENPPIDFDESSKKIILPFLNDTPPYGYSEPPRVSAKPIYSEEDMLFCGKYAVGKEEYVTVDEWYRKGCPDVSVLGRIAYKTRMAPITHEKRQLYHFFILLTSSDNAIKVNVHERDVPYSSMGVGDVIGLETYEKEEGSERIRTVEYNGFTEAVYFKCKEVNARKLARIRIEKNGVMPRLIFDVISGRVRYLSVLNRRRRDVLDEYCLINIEKKKILLFYNSSKSFHTIKVGNYLRITNLRVMTRGDTRIYISTIYTQIEILLRRLQQASPSSLKVGEFDVPIDGGYGESEEVESGVRDSVFGAVGYLPDNFSTVEDMYLRSVEVIHGKKHDVEPFMTPQEMNLRSMMIDVENMVLNESKKYLVEATLMDVYFSNFVKSEPEVPGETISVSYEKDGVLNKQVPAYISIYNEVNLVVCLFNNFWLEEHTLESLYRLGGTSSLQELKDMRGRKMKFVINAFRDTKDGVMFLLTKTFKLDS